MELRLGYKQTEVGVIPEEWDLRGLLTTVRIANGQVDPRDEPFRSMILVAPDHIESGTGKLLEKQTAADQRAISGKYRFTAGDIVYSKIRPYLRKAILADFDGLCSADMYPLKPANDVIGGFVLPVLLAHRFTKYAESVSVRSGMPKINRAELAEFVIALPQPPEQRAIATALSDADALLGALDGLIAKKRDLKQAAMQQLLTGQTCLPGFSGEWEVKRLGEVTEIVMGQSPDSKHYNRTGAGVPLIQGNADIEKRRSIARVWTTQITKEGRAGDLLLTVRAPVGAVGRISERCCLGRGVCSLRPKSDSDFLFHALVFAERAWKVLEQGSTFTSANSTQVAAFSIPIPSDIPEQTAIAAVLSDMDAEIEALEARRAKTHDLKQAMMQELLTGRTRLI